jgi:choline dehydrogenase
LEDPAPADLATDETLDQWMMREAHTFSHISGTCKMGPESDPMSVVDQYGKVRGVDGLRVADASIMPDLVRAPINPTVIMLGERIADLIQQRT